MAGSRPQGALNKDFRLFGDSAAYRMYKGVLAAWQARAFKADMSPERAVTAEWVFGKIQIRRSATRR